MPKPLNKEESTWYVREDTRRVSLIMVATLSVIRAASHSIHIGVGIGRSPVQHLVYALLSNPRITPGRRRAGRWSSNQLFCTASLVVNTNTSEGKKRNPVKPGDKSKINSKVSPHRAVSAVRLLRIEQGGAFADLLSADCRENAIDDEMDYIQRTLGFRTNPLDARNTRLVTDIVAGVVRWKRYLDYLIFSLYNGATRVKNMEPLLQQILRIGVYEIVKLGMPPYAVVNENVTLARAALRAGAGNMVNGILRRVASDREKDMLPLPKVEGDNRSKARALSVKYSHPVWMVRRWMTYLGQEGTIQLMEWNNSPPSFSLRANSGRGVSRDDLVLLLNKLKVPHELSPHMTEFVRLPMGLQHVIQAGLLKEGMCAVQDEAAGLVVSVVDPQPGETIIDCCAAPGGKALFMASRLQGQGSIIAIDVNQARLRLLEAAAKMQALDSVVNACQDDIRSFAAGASIRADKVLLDAPCSGLGVLCKKPDLRWKRTLKDLEQLILLQDELLDAASLLVKPGGILVYSTCSVDPGENNERVESFLTRHPEFIVEAVHKYVPNEFISEEGFFISHPTKHFLDGAFAARLFRVSI